ncbi:uncharacterized protein LOC110772731 [Prunus avium]|uniref:Uncharacterized protein LOC110772731 n=1 Tax=Prunus avium TaxID=42229 RepID=A0A6P5U110_PRUAV|nr:uncharacterized protein LOC110772731 [Prunus avium]
MALQLPEHLALKSEYNHKYLRYRDYIDTVQGVLHFSGEEVVSPYTKFHAEDSGISSCYNNKFWRTAGEEDKRIVADVDEKPPNPLFNFEYVHQEDKIVRLFDVQHNKYLQIRPEDECLIVSDVLPDHNPTLFNFKVIDWDTLVIFPTLVAFIGDNGSYLRVQSNGEYPFLQFSANEPTDPTVEVEVSFTRDGYVHYRSTYNQRFWKRAAGTNWILADTDDTTVQDATLFWPVKVNIGNVNVVVALQCNNNFCRRLNWGAGIESLNAALPSPLPPVTPEAHLTVRELVKSRTIFDLNFHVDDARIYNRRHNVVVATGVAQNRTLKSAYAVILLSYEDTSTWISNLDDFAFTSLIPTTLTSDTLFVLNDDEGDIIGILGHFDGPYHWGEDHISKTQIRFPVVVPPMSKVKVTLLATTTSCDIPFSYSQRDTLIRQTPAAMTYIKEGGLYTGVSSYNFKHRRETERLAG